MASKKARSLSAAVAPGPNGGGPSVTVCRSVSARSTTSARISPAREPKRWKIVPFPTPRGGGNLLDGDVAGAVLREKKVRRIEDGESIASCIASYALHTLLAHVCTLVVDKLTGGPHSAITPSSGPSVSLLAAGRGSPIRGTGQIPGVNGGRNT